MNKYIALGASAGGIITLAYEGNPLSAVVGTAISTLPALIIAPVLNFTLANIRRSKNLDFNLSNPSKEQQYILGSVLGATISMPVGKRIADSLENIIGLGETAQTVATAGTIGIIATSAVGGAYLSKKLFSSYQEERNQ